MTHQVRWTATKIARRLQLIEPLIYRRRQELAPFHYTVLPGPMAPPLVDPEIDDGNWDTIAPNTYWGQWFTDVVLRTRFQIPQDWGRESPIALHLPLGEAGDFSHPEFLAYVDGTAFAACDRHHQEITLLPQWSDGQAHLLALHGWTGLGGLATGEPATKLFMRPCALVQIHQATRDFTATVRVALSVANCLGADHPAKGLLLNALDAAFQVLDTREPFAEGFYRSVPLAHAVLREGISRAGPPLEVDVVATGHAHIDVAWLWTLGQTRRKSRRTFYNVLRLMAEFPEFRFAQSQPQLYDYVRQDDPGLFAAIAQRVHKGRWEPIGGTWVEMDCNISGAESLARQFLLGRTFFDRYFPGAESPVLWLPDVFGFSWALPQLMAQAGINYFLTTKLGWNQYNRLPYDSFWWQGLDGTRVLVHFVCTPGDGFGVSTYNGTATPEQVLGTWTTFQQKELQHKVLTTVGHGDGGGGPTREMLENLQEMSAFPGMPRVRQGPVIEFFHNLESESGPRLPTWNGELYLEYHRGTYTTQSRSKRANRKSEFLLHDAEFLATMASILDADYEYPAGRLRRAWELVCLNQFHDILPGSSIGPVYAESMEQYTEVEQQATAVRDAALDVLASTVGGDLIVVNPTGFPRNDLAYWPKPIPSARRSDGAPVLTQGLPHGTLIAAGELAPFSVTALSLGDRTEPMLETSLGATPTTLENDYLYVELDTAGDIVRIYDRVNEREILPPGAIANQFQAFEDRPLEFDAWDIDIFYDDKMWISDPADSVQVVEAGPLRATLEVRRRVLHSEYVQRISLTHNSARLDFDTRIDWRERHVLLKAAFPVEILSPVATYEIQWGNLERPTHRNTSWDWARFETCAQKWVDLGEGDYGTSLLNDCKYGHDVRDNVIRITLLKSPSLPDPTADLGEHHFAYSLLPHTGQWGEETIRAAYALNDPLIVAQGRGEKRTSGIPDGVTQGGSLRSFISVDRPNVVIETVKQAEDGRGVIVRFYESQRRRGSITVRTSFDIAEAWKSNLLEENQVVLEPESNTVRLSIEPYQIVTLRLVPSEL